MTEHGPTKKNPLEGSKQLELHVKEPDGIHRNWGITLDTAKETKALSSAYNRAIEDVAKSKHIPIFHQMSALPGSSNANAPAKHVWEFWSDINREEIEKLFPEIEVQAQELYPVLKELYEPKE